MSEDSMLELVQNALQKEGLQDELIAVGQFNPRGHSGALFAGGLMGSEAGGRLAGNLGSDVGVAAGSLAGQRAADRTSGLPPSMLVAASAESVYGFDAPSRHSEPRALLFKLSRRDLKATVHQRFNVRILQLTDERTGDTIELEGNRLPVTHSGDLIKALTGGSRSS
jgi:hypothetical protein